jgi:DNA polymerase III subunit chi
MTQVDFYILREASDPARLALVCRLAEKAFLAGQRALVWAQDAAELAQLDGLLWTFSEKSFVPHEPLAADPLACDAPVQLTAAEQLPDDACRAFAVLLSLRTAANGHLLRFARVLEVIDGEPRRRDAGRARFRFYREQGITPLTHNLDNDG